MSGIDAVLRIAHCTRIVFKNFQEEFSRISKFSKFLNFQIKEKKLIHFQWPSCVSLRRPRKCHLSLCHRADSSLNECALNSLSSLNSLTANDVRPYGTAVYWLNSIERRDPSNATRLEIANCDTMYGCGATLAAVKLPGEERSLEHQTAEHSASHPTVGHSIARHPTARHPTAKHSTDLLSTLY